MTSDSIYELTGAGKERSLKKPRLLRAGQKRSFRNYAYVCVARQRVPEGRHIRSYMDKEKEEYEKEYVDGARRGLPQTHHICASGDPQMEERGELHHLQFKWE